LDRLLLAQIVYVVIIVIMLLSALWVLADTRKRGRPWGEILVWTMFAGWFFGLGLVTYIVWKKKVKD